MPNTRSAWRGSIPMPLSSIAKRHAAPSRSARTRTLRAHARRDELDRVADQVLEQLHELLRVALHRRAARPTRSRAARPRERAQRRGDLADHARGVDGLGRALGAAGARVGEQVLDQRPHPGGALDGVVDERVGVVVELAVVAAAQQLQVAGDHPQRLGEVVRGDVGELRELGVGALELGGPHRHLALLPARLGDVAADGHPADQAPLLVVERHGLHAVDDLGVGRLDVEGLRLAGERGPVARRDLRVLLGGQRLHERQPA